MKIVAFIFLFLAAFFTVQPIISNRLMASATTCCMKMKCSDGSTGNKSNDNKKCGNEDCCLCMFLSYSGVYVVEKNDFSFPDLAAQKEKKAAVNDDRLSTGLSESWHPPECTHLIHLLS